MTPDPTRAAAETAARLVIKEWQEKVIRHGRRVEYAPLDQMWLLGAIATALQAERQAGARATWEAAAVVLDEMESTARAIARDHEDHGGLQTTGEFFWQHAKAFQAGAAALRAAAEEAGA